MKKYLSLVMIGLSLMLSGCNKDDNNDPNTPPTGDTGKVRYEATVSDPENFKLLIHYTVGVDISSEAPEEAAKEIIVESPFTFEQEAKQGTYLWLSAYPIPKDEENLENLQLPKTVEEKTFNGLERKSGRTDEKTPKKRMWGLRFSGEKIGVPVDMSVRLYADTLA